MQVINNNELFTQVAAEESVTASGGGPVTAGNYLIASTFVGLGGTATQINTALLYLANAQAGLNGIITP